MRTRWQYRIFAFVPTAARDAAQRAWTLIAPGGDAERLTFDVALSPDGTYPATHYGTNTAATDIMRALMLALTDGVTWYVMEYREGALLESSGGGETGFPFSWSAALANMGLKVIRDNEV